MIEQPASGKADLPDRMRNLQLQPLRTKRSVSNRVRPLLSPPSAAALHASRFISRSKSSGHEQDLYSTLEIEELHSQRRKAKAAVSIQKAYRKVRFLWLNFGSMMFSRKDCAPADYGKLVFAGADLASGAASRFITVSDTTSVGLLCNYLSFAWKLARPEVLISITGGARDFGLTPRLQHVFDRGLVDAARASKAWLITGGTDTGVMKLVADAMASHGVHLPVIGIAPLGCVNKRGALYGCRGDTVEYPSSSATQLGAPLNKHHSHFIFVDNGVDSPLVPAPWGSETLFRAKLEAVYREQKNVPTVLLVVQGGPGTLQTIIDSARVDTPIVIVAESGGAATAVFKFAEQDGKIEPGFESKEDMLQEISQLHRDSDSQLLTFFLSDDQDADLGLALLQAMVKMFQSKSRMRERRNPGRNSASGRRSSDSEQDLDRFSGALQLSISWNRFDVFLTVIEEMQQITKGFTSAHHQALQRSLMLQREKMISYLLAMQECTLEELHMMRLYTIEDKFSFLYANVELRERISKNVDAIFDARDGKSVQLYHDIIRPLFDSLTPLLSPILHSGCVRVDDIFIWSTIIGNRSLALELWPRCANPLSLVLLASRVSKQVAKHINWGHLEMEQLGLQMEGWAVGVMQMVPSQDVAHRILSRISKTYPLSVADLALHLGMKEFLSHRYAQSLADDIWRGAYSCRRVEAGTSSSMVRSDGRALPRNFSYAFLVLRSLVPCTLCRNAWSATRTRKNQESDYPSMSPYVFEAMATTLKIAREENSQSRSAMPEAERRRRLSESSDRRLSENSEQVKAIRSTAANLSSRRLALGHHGDLKNQSQKDEEQADRSFHSIPAVKFTIRVTLHVVQLLLYARVLAMTVSVEELRSTMSFLLPLSEAELAFILLTVFLGIDEFHQWYALRKWRMQKLQDTLTKVVFVSDALVVIAVAFRIMSALPAMGFQSDLICKRMYIVYQLTLSFNVILTSMRLVTYLSVRQQFGILVIIIQEMIDDLVLFFQLFIIVVISFSLALTGLSADDVEAWGRAEGWVDGNGKDHIDLLKPAAMNFSGFPLREGSSPSSPDKSGAHSSEPPWYATESAFMLPFWATLQTVDLDVIEGQLTHFTLVMWLFMLISSVVMVNLLVAMFSETYSRIKTRAEIEYLYQKSLRIFVYVCVVHSVPPILNAPLIAFELLADLGRACSSKLAELSVYGKPDVDASHRTKSIEDEPGNDSSETTYYVNRFLEDQFRSEDSAIEKLMQTTQGSVSSLRVEILEQAQSTKDALAELTNQLTSLAAKVELLHKDDRNGDEEGAPQATQITSPPAASTEFQESLVALAQQRAILEEERRRAQQMHRKAIAQHQVSIRHDSIVHETASAARATAATLQRIFDCNVHATPTGHARAQGVDLVPGDSPVDDDTRLSSIRQRIAQLGEASIVINRDLGGQTPQSRVAPGASTSTPSSSNATDALLRRPLPQQYV